MRALCSSVAFLLAACAAQQQRPCDETCASARHFILVVGATMNGCAHAFPDDQATFVDAFWDWNGTKLQIPGLKEALVPSSPEYAQALTEVAGDFRKSPRMEQEIQCYGYAKKLQQQDLMLPKNVVQQFESGS